MFFVKKTLTALILASLVFSPFSLRAAVDWPDLKYTEVASGFSSVTQVVCDPKEAGRLYVLEQSGVITTIGNSGDRRLFLKLQSKVNNVSEQGLLSMAFSPKFESNRWFYIHYSRVGDGAGVISRVRASKADPLVANPGSEEVLLLIPQPFSNHNGGQLAFGPDGYLYIGKGDGGGQGDPESRAQNPNLLLGKILRIDVESGAFPYRIPADNPYVGKPRFRPEIWALGLRNPWRFSFDRLTGDLLIGDVGQSSWEEVDFHKNGRASGQNFGWPRREGFHDFRPDPNKTAKLAEPIFEYGHDLGVSIIGGVVSRGGKGSRLEGLYLFGDFSGAVGALVKKGGVWKSKFLKPGPPQITSFAEDGAGKVYLSTYDGKIIRVRDR